MEPDAAWSFVCNWKHMQSKVKSKAEPTLQTDLLLLPAPVFLSCPLLSGLGCPILAQAKWEATLQNLRWVTEWAYLAFHVKVISMGWLYHVPFKLFQSFTVKCEWHFKGLQRMEALTLTMTGSENTGYSVILVCYSLKCLEASEITDSYITTLCKGKIAQGRNEYLSNSSTTP